MTTINESKDQAAQESGYIDWNDFFNLNYRNPNLIVNLMSEAMELYAESKAKDFGEYLINSVNTERIGIEEAEEVSERYYKRYQNNQY